MENLDFGLDMVSSKEPGNVSKQENSRRIIGQLPMSAKLRSMPVDIHNITAEPGFPRSNLIINSAHPSNEQQERPDS
jgi:hypothetical protein